MTRIMEVSLLAATSLALVGMTFWGLNIWADSLESPTFTLGPCAQEDSDNCYWDAALFGNHEGTSFVTLNGVTYYPEDAK